MPRALRLDRVDDVRIKLAYGNAAGGSSQEVFLLDLHLPAPERFDEFAYLEVLEPVVESVEEAQEPCVVHLMRTHRCGSGSDGEAQIAIGLAAPSAKSAATDRVTTAFREILRRVSAVDSHTLGHAEAVAEARRRVEEAYPEVMAESLVVTEEQHHARARMWSVGMVDANAHRFSVLLGFVDGMPGTAHVRRLPASEVVDSVGTD